MPRHSRPSVLLALTALVGFRLLYGLSMPFWFEDERQVYLIGLQSFARQEWPYFGPDVVWTGGQIPGALLGWLIRLPLTIWPAPEAPVVLINLLSAGALALLAWYLCRRLPGVPRWLIWFSLFTLPWTLNFSTHVVNPSFVLAGAIVFFVGVFEATPQLRRGIVPFALAWSMIGCGLLWVMQLHLSWVLLAPYAIAATAAVAWGGVPGAFTRAAALARAAAGFVAGAALPAALLVPTILRYGWDAGLSQGAVEFHWQSPLELVTTAARVLSFASFEITRFVGMSTAERVFFLLRRPLVVVAIVPVVLAGVVHPLWMAVSACRQSPSAADDWTRVRWLLAGTIVLIFASYFYSVRGPQAHAFYLGFPVAALFAFTCWEVRGCGRSRLMSRIAAVVLVCNAIVHTGLAWDRWQRQSLYVDRALVAAAIDDRDGRYLGERRGTARDIRATTDLEVARVEWKPWRGFSRFDVTVRNTSQSLAWLDVRLAISYTDAAGTPLETREIVVKQILQPGEERSWTDLADGRVPERAVAATLRVIEAERVRTAIILHLPIALAQHDLSGEIRSY